jgi:hypothetical protein
MARVFWLFRRKSVARPPARTDAWAAATVQPGELQPECRPRRRAEGLAADEPGRTDAGAALRLAAEVRAAYV